MTASVQGSAGCERLIDSAVYVSLDWKIENEPIVDTSVPNFGAGHAIPTGEPMRALHLTSTTDSSCGVPTVSEGPAIPDTGGAYAQCIVGESCLVTDGDGQMPFHFNEQGSESERFAPLFSACRSQMAT